MDIFELNRVNQLALAAAADQFVPPGDVPERANAFAYHGFIDCEAAPGQGRFVMFSNDDDVVAKHYLFSGPSSFEATTLAVWCQLARQARWVFDIGAFTGVFSLAAAAANPNAIVSAFEPSFITYSRLLTNIYANRYAGQIAPLRFGVGAEAGELELRHPYGVYTMASGESFSATHISDPWFTETVPIISIDTYLSDQDALDRQRVVSTRIAGADLMKIDVEGFELEVLKGMRQTLARERPTIIMEILDSAEEPKVMALLGDGYQMLHIDDDTGQVSAGAGGRNKLLFHASRRDLVDRLLDLTNRK